MTQAQTTTPDIEQIYATMMLQRAIAEAKAGYPRAVTWRNTPEALAEIQTRRIVSLQERTKKLRETTLAKIGADKFTSSKFADIANIHQQSATRALSEMESLGMVVSFGRVGMSMIYQQITRDFAPTPDEVKEMWDEMQRKAKHRDKSTKNNPRPCEIDGVHYASLSDASRAIGISVQAVRKRINKVENANDPT